MDDLEKISFQNLCSHPCAFGCVLRCCSILLIGDRLERAALGGSFFNDIEKITSSVLLFHRIERAEQVARDFSDKGLYYFDADDGTRLGICTLRRYYTKRSYPQKPLKYECLPEHIREALKHNFMEIEDFSLEDTIYIKHAYE